MIPPELVERDQWLVYRIETRDGKPTKVPYRAANPGVKADSTDPETWASHEQAIACVESGAAEGIGFVFTRDDPYTGIDLDDCFNEAGELHPEAGAVVVMLDSFTERSQSGNGLHVLVRGELAENARHRTGDVPWRAIEVYDERRFFVVTGDHLRGTPETIEERQDELDRLIARYLPPRSEPAASAPAAAGVTLDVDLLERARAARNGRAFDDLYAGRWQGTYPSQSEADLALCGMLAFWTRGDPARIDGLFRGSGLMRAKWERADYRESTIEAAIADRTEFYEPRASSAEPAATGDVENDPTGTSLTLLTSREWSELPPPSKEDTLLGDYLTRGERLLIGGATGHGKSMFAMQAIAAVVKREPFLDILPPAGEHKALVLDLEQGQLDIQRCVRECGLGTCDDVMIASIPDGLALDSNPNHVALIDSLIRAQRYSIVYVSPLFKAHRGDSNDERAATDLMRLLDRWRVEHGFALIMDTHVRKRQEGRSGFSIDDLFGSSAYVRGAEIVLGIERKAHGISFLYHFKDRSGVLEVPSRRKLTYTKGLGFDLADVEDAPPRDYAGEVLRYLRSPEQWQHEQARASGWTTTGEIAAACSANKNRVREILNDLAAEGIIERQEGPEGRHASSVCWRSESKSPGYSRPPDGGGEAKTPPEGGSIRESDSDGGSGGSAYIGLPVGSTTCSRLLEVVRSTPGLRQPEARKRAGLDVGEFYAAIKELRDRDLVVLETAGDDTRLYPKER